MSIERPQRLRLFVAIELPEVWLEGLAEAQRRMQAAIRANPATAATRLRWVRPEGIHLTLKFLGEIEASRLNDIPSRLALAVPVMPEMELSLAATGAFTDRRAPRVLWAGVADSPAQSLVNLAGAIDRSLVEAGVPREHRPFRPHLTLARLPDALSDAERQRAAEIALRESLPEMPSFRPDGVSLMQSFLGPRGARYERRGKWPLQLYSQQ